MINKYVVAKSGGTGKSEYWNGSSSANNAWGSINSAKLYDSEDSAMTAFCGGVKFAGKVSKTFMESVSQACRLLGTVEVSIIKIIPDSVKRFSISSKNFA